MTLTWEMVGGATSLIVVVQALTLFVIRATVRDEIGKLNGTYIRRGECILAREAEDRQHSEVIRRIERLEAK